MSGSWNKYSNAIASKSCLCCRRYPFTLHSHSFTRRVPFDIDGLIYFDTRRTCWIELVKPIKQFICKHIVPGSLGKIQTKKTISFPQDRRTDGVFWRADSLNSLHAQVISQAWPWLSQEIPSSGRHYCITFAWWCCSLGKPPSLCFVVPLKRKPRVESFQVLKWFSLLTKHQKN
jgi:hypothetical protein